jgi:hypothetical protein
MIYIYKRINIISMIDSQSDAHDLYQYDGREVNVNFNRQLPVYY